MLNSAEHEIFLLINVIISIYVGILTFMTNNVEILTFMTRKKSNILCLSELEKAEFLDICILKSI